MANEKYILRYLKIIQRIKRGDYPNRETILDYLSDNGFGINKRTFSRDRNVILELFDIEICFDRVEKGYHIVQDDGFNVYSGRLQETLDLFSSIQIVGKEKNIISFGKRKPLGTENMFYILDAIKNSKILSFNHIKFQDQKTTQRTVEPYMLKESQGRWYLVAKDKNDNKVKTFGLDRISLPESGNALFNKPDISEIDKMFKDSFGIVNTNDPKDITIKAYGANALYIKSYKLHESQNIIEETKNSISFSMRLSITDDFVMELMQYGADIEVIEPVSLKTRLIENYKKALERYK